MNKNINDIFRENLNYYLKEKEKTQKELAEYLNVSTAIINYYVNGKNTPRMDKVDKICKFFSIDRTDLLEPRKTNQKPTIQFDKKIIQQRFLNTMVSRNLTQEKISDITNIPLDRVNGYILGTNEPKVEELEKIAEVLNVSLDFLIGNDSDEQIKLLARRMGNLDPDILKRALKEVDKRIEEFEKEQLLKKE